MDSEGYVYAKHMSNSSGNKTFWRCGRKSKNEGWKCPARVTTEGVHIIKYIGVHSHLPNTANSRNRILPSNETQIPMKPEPRFQ